MDPFAKCTFRTFQPARPKLHSKCDQYPALYGENTASQQRLAFAKICVEVEALRVIPRTIEVKMKEGSVVSVVVDIPWYPQRCSQCETFGHGEKLCPKTKEAAPAKVWVPKQGVEKIGSTKEIIKEKEVDNGGIQEASISEIIIDKIKEVEDHSLEKIAGSPSPGSANRFAALVEGMEEVKEGAYELIDQELLGPRKARIAAVEVAELMKTLKPKRNCR